MKNNFLTALLFTTAFSATAATAMDFDLFGKKEASSLDTVQPERATSAKKTNRRAATRQVVEGEELPILTQKFEAASVEEREDEDSQAAPSAEKEFEEEEEEEGDDESSNSSASVVEFDGVYTNDTHPVEVIEAEDGKSIYGNNKDVLEMANQAEKLSDRLFVRSEELTASKLETETQKALVLSITEKLEAKTDELSQAQDLIDSLLQELSVASTALSSNPYGNLLKLMVKYGKHTTRYANCKGLVEQLSTQLPMAESALTDLMSQADAAAKAAKAAKTGSASTTELPTVSQYQEFSRKRLTGVKKINALKLTTSEAFAQFFTDNGISYS